ncbi:MAG: sel1 repeat family protein [Myxococcales bacterium]|nr:sel1 repeat family protein [Myxococcales bacterium]
MARAQLPPPPPGSLAAARAAMTPPSTIAACREGNGDACYEAGKKLYRLAAVLVSTCGARPDASLCQNHRMLKKQHAKIEVALGLFERGCDGGSLPACVLLGMAYRDGDVVLPKPEAAQRLLTKACTSRHVGGCVALGELYQGRGRVGDLSAATVYFRRACLLGYGRGCAKLAEAYRTGRGVDADKRRARSLRERACKLGDRGSCPTGQLKP